MRKQSFVLFAFLILYGAVQSQITVNIRKSFVDSFKNRLTIDANYEIYFAHPHPNPAKKDADLHFAGYDKRIGLPIVAEVMNAKEQSPALQIIHDNEGKGAPQHKVKLTGVWRLWCEHPGDIQDFVQGKKNIPIENTNPPHVFEIHPATKIENVDLLSSFHKIDGFDYKDAEDAFSRYSSLRCKLKQKGKLVSIESTGIGYNYVNFWIQLNDNQKQQVSDGLFIYCSIYASEIDTTSEGNEDGLISHKLRIGFVKGSAVYDKAANLTKGQYLHVLGIPRIDLALVSWRIAHAKDRPEALQWNLPFEMVAVAELE